MTAELTLGQKRREAYAHLVAGAQTYAEIMGYPIPTDSQLLAMAQTLTESKADEVRKKYRDVVLPSI